MRISDWSSDVCSSDLTVWLITFDDDHDTTIARGENGGRALHNSNVVRALSTLGTWSGEAVTFPLDFAAAKAAGRGGCAVVVKPGRGGPIHGAAVISETRRVGTVWVRTFNSQVVTDHE